MYSNVVMLSVYVSYIPWYERRYAAVWLVVSNHLTQQCSVCQVNGFCFRVASTNCPVRGSTIRFENTYSPWRRLWSDSNGYGTRLRRN